MNPEDSSGIRQVSWTWPSSITFTRTMRTTDLSHIFESALGADHEDFWERKLIIASREGLFNRNISFPVPWGARHERVPGTEDEPVAAPVHEPAPKKKPAPESDGHDRVRINEIKKI